jgi:hypothetical protein
MRSVLMRAVILPVTELTPGRAPGDLRGLRVWTEAHHDGDFAPPDLPWGGPGALVLDRLQGTTDGEDSGSVPTQ